MEATQPGHPVVVDAATCTGCGLCAKVCHEHCLSIDGKVPRIDPASCPLSRDSAQYALANIIYGALVRGVGSCLCGNGPMCFDKDNAIRKRLGLLRRDNILGALMLGYPEVRFSNRVSGKALPILWAGASAELQTEREAPFLEQARAAAAHTIEGWQMLLAQGARSFELWTGREAPRQVMAAALREALGF